METMLHDDERFMAHALALAARGIFTTTPNPRVGCVIVANGTILGEGWHVKAGEPHAEVFALRAAGDKARGATAYVTLEPCSHFGRTPPCADALVAAGVSRVVVAMQDPDPRVSGKGIARLRAGGIDVLVSILEAEARALNEGFLSRVERGRPWLRIKSAASLDGRTALANGVSQWITGEAARQDGHRWRAQSCGILTGVNTVLADNPKLNVRGIDTARQPRKIVVDTHLRTPLDAKVLDGGDTILATTIEELSRHRPYLDSGAEILVLPTNEGRVHLPQMMMELGKRGFNEVLTEAGARLNGALIATGCADALLLYLAPSLLGGDARGMFKLPEISSLDDRVKLVVDEIKPLANDIRILARFAH